MDLVQGFIASNTFYDDKNYPHGLSRSGVFSIAEAELLSKVGNRLFSLAQGVVSSENQVEENFVKVCQGEQEAATKVELLWKKYQSSIRKPAMISLASSDISFGDSDISNEELT